MRSQSFIVYQKNICVPVTSLERLTGYSHRPSESQSNLRRVKPRAPSSFIFIDKRSFNASGHYNAHGNWLDDTRYPKFLGS